MSGRSSIPPQVQPSDVVHLVGDVDVGTARDVRDRLHASISGRRGSLVVDLSGVTFMDCTGVGLLLEVSIAIGGPMVLLRCPRSVSELLRVTDTYDAFTVVAG